jgi:hypothetical protein
LNLNKLAELKNASKIAEVTKDTLPDNQIGLCVPLSVRKISIIQKQLGSLGWKTAVSRSFCI